MRWTGQALGWMCEHRLHADLAIATIDGGQSKGIIMQALEEPLINSEGCPAACGDFDHGPLHSWQ